MTFIITNFLESGQEKVFKWSVRFISCQKQMVFYIPIVYYFCVWLHTYIHYWQQLTEWKKMLLLTSWLSWDKFNGYCIMIVLLLYFGIYKNIRLTISL